MTTYAFHGASPERRAWEERAVLLRLLRSPATMAELRDDLAARIGTRMDTVLDRLRRGRHVDTDGKAPARYSLTDAGKEMAEQLRTQQ